MQFLQYSLQKKPDDRLAVDELLELDFIQNAYSDFPFTMPPEDEKWNLSLTEHRQLY
jgi:hypothetical protein